MFRRSNKEWTSYLRQHGGSKMMRIIFILLIAVFLQNCSDKKTLQSGDDRSPLIIIQDNDVWDAFSRNSIYTKYDFSMRAKDLIFESDTLLIQCASNKYLESMHFDEFKVLLNQAVNRANKELLIGIDTVVSSCRDSWERSVFNMEILKKYLFEYLSQKYYQNASNEVKTLYSKFINTDRYKDFINNNWNNEEIWKQINSAPIGVISRGLNDNRLHSESIAFVSDFYLSKVWKDKNPMEFNALLQAGALQRALCNNYHEPVPSAAKACFRTRILSDKEEWFWPEGYEKINYYRKELLTFIVRHDLSLNRNVLRFKFEVFSMQLYKNECRNEALEFYRKEFQIIADEYNISYDPARVLKKILGSNFDYYIDDFALTETQLFEKFNPTEGVDFLPTVEIKAIMKYVITDYKTRPFEFEAIFKETDSELSDVLFNEMSKRMVGGHAEHLRQYSVDEMRASNAYSNLYYNTILKSKSYKQCINDIPIYNATFTQQLAYIRKRGHVQYFSPLLSYINKNKNNMIDTVITGDLTSLRKNYSNGDPVKFYETLRF